MSSLMMEALVAGVLLGGVYVLAALGLNIIYGVLDIINFAHGAMMMIGMYISYYLFTLGGVDPYLSVAITGPALFVLGMLVYRYLLEPMRSRGIQNQFLVTVGLALFLTNLAQVLFSPDYRTLQPSYSNTVWMMGDFSIPITRIWTFLVAMAAALALLLLFRFSRWGKAIRAVAQSQDGAALCGINVRKVYTVAFGLGSLCVGIAGAAVTPIFYIAPPVGDVFNIASFVVVVLGGLGSMGGAVIGGIILGIAVSLGAILLPGSLKEVLMLGVFLLVLLVRPTGLLGAKA